MKEDFDCYECPPEIYSDMENWRRWATGRSNTRNCCMSIESRYRSTDVFDGKEARIQINILEAVVVEKIIRTLPKKNKAAIKAYHIQRLPTHIMRRKLGERDIGCLMRNSWCMIKNLLEKQKMCYLAVITDEPSLDETDRQKAA